jgi:predicted ATP-dependent endonuclease of OLD family
MKFSKLFIRNFRSVGPEGLEINFAAEQRVAVLVGANSSGKTNILTALGIVLDCYPFSRFLPEETDFHAADTAEELLIELYLSPPLVDHDVYRKEYTVAGFRYRATRYLRGDQKGSLHIEHYCFDQDGKILVKPARMFRRKGQPDDGVDNTPKPVQVSDHAWKIGDEFYLDPQTLEYFFDKTSGRSPLGRLFEIYRDDFEAEHNQFLYDSNKTMPSREAFQRFSKRIAEILRTQKLQDIEAGLSSRMAQYLGLPFGNPLKVEFSMPTHRELFEKWVTLRIGERTGATPLPIDRLGSGYRALLRLAVLQTLLDMRPEGPKCILLIEEPEVYLHVHLRRYFFKVLLDLADAGHQVIYTTHSPEFADLGRPHEIIRVHKLAFASTQARQVATATKLDFEHVRQKVGRMGNEEIFFANYAILTEGQDDQGVVQELLTRAGIDVNVHSISVVNCDGAGQIKDYVRLCAELGIDFYAIHDRDRRLRPVREKTQ